MMERYKLEIVNNHGDRYVRCEPATDGPWVMFKDVAELQNKGCARDQTTTQYCAEVIERDKRIAELEAALEKLARLGAEPYYGNSDGNMIARAALKGGKDG